MRDISGVILAGGEGRRLGRPKDRLEIRGVNVVEHLVRSLNPLFEEVLIVRSGDLRDDRRWEELGARTVRDLLSMRGAMVGLYTGLREMRTPYGFFIGGDMPFPNCGLVRYMLSLHRDFEAVVPRRGEYLEPLFAIYAKDLLPFVERLILRGERRISKILEGARAVRFVEEEEIRAFDPEFLSFFNINTPRDLEQAERIAGRFFGGEGDDKRR